MPTVRNLVFVFAIVASACAPKTPTLPPTPTMSAAFQEYVSSLLDDGSTLNAMTAAGVNHSDYKKQLAQTSSDYDLMLAIGWPDGFAPGAQDELDQAFKGWELAGYLWDLKVNRETVPIEPDSRRYAEFVEYAGVKLTFNTCSGKKCISYENVGLLLSMASAYFESGRAILIKNMP
jgi:hypothetical protein